MWTPPPELARILGPEPDDGLDGLSVDQLRLRMPPPGIGPLVAAHSDEDAAALVADIRRRAKRSKHTDARRLEGIARQIEAEAAARRRKT